jgi:hypothetical protein
MRQRLASALEYRPGLNRPTVSGILPLPRHARFRPLSGIWDLPLSRLIGEGRDTISAAGSHR